MTQRKDLDLTTSKKDLDLTTSVRCVNIKFSAMSSHGLERIFQGQRQPVNIQPFFVSTYTFGRCFATSATTSTARVAIQ